jgi:NitT/TauT family transport system permease protein
VFPAYVTGGITAAGGAWNASIVAEIVTYGRAPPGGQRPRRLHRPGDREQRLPEILAGIMVMSFYVVVVNRLLWRRLYASPSRNYAL